MNRLPTLDAWRGIAIALVLFDHLQAAILGGYYRPWLQTGQHGVTIFFVLSGFLITSKLLEGPINLRRFYLRRFFRLMPVAWIYLAAVSLFTLFGEKQPVSFPELASCLFSFRNFFGPGPSLYFAHFWSLAIEEQFYLVWPCLLLFLGFHRARWLPIAIAITAAVSIALYRTALWPSYNQQWRSFHTEVRADALLVGCLLALLHADPRWRKILERWSGYLWLPALATLLWSIAFWHWLPPLYESVAIALLLSATVLHPQAFAVRPLQARSLAWLGTVSYSVYVWQQVFFVYRGAATTIPLLMLMPVFALGSYYLVERPATRLGHRLTSRNATQKAPKHEPAHEPEHDPSEALAATTP